MILEFVRRPHGDATEPSEFGIPISPAPFGQIGRNRSACASNLGSEAIHFFPRKVCRRSIHEEGQLMGLLPGPEFVKVPDGPLMVADISAISTCRGEGTL